MLWCVPAVVRNAEWFGHKDEERKGKNGVVDKIGEETFQWSTMPRWEILNIIQNS